MYRVDFPSSCAKFWIQVSLILTRSHLANAVNIDKVIGANRKIEISRFVFTDYGQISADRDYNALNDLTRVIFLSSDLKISLCTFVH